MNSYCSDVNTLFAFVDIRHKFHQIVADKFESIKDQKYVLLNHVKNTFVFTYSDNLKRIGEIIISVVNRVKEKLEKRRLRNPPSDVVKNAYLKEEMWKLINEVKDKELKSTDYDYYKNMLLNDFPLIELLNDNEKFREFDSFYIEKADEIVCGKIEEFVSFFKTIEKSPRLNANKVREWRTKLKATRKLKINTN